MPTQKIDQAMESIEELFSTQATRTGHAAARVAALCTSNVPSDVIALLLTRNAEKSGSALKFGSADVEAIAKFHRANRARTALSKRQAKALVIEQRSAEQAPLLI